MRQKFLRTATSGLICIMQTARNQLLNMDESRMICDSHASVVNARIASRAQAFLLLCIYNETREIIAGA